MKSAWSVHTKGAANSFGCFVAFATGRASDSMASFLIYGLHARCGMIMLNHEYGGAL